MMIILVAGDRWDWGIRHNTFMLLDIILFYLEINPLIKTRDVWLAETGG